MNWNSIPYCKFLFVGLTNICWVPSVFEGTVRNFPVETVTHPGTALLVFKPNIRSSQGTHTQNLTKSPPAGFMVVLLFSGSVGNLASWDQVCRELKQTLPRINSLGAAQGRGSTQPEARGQVPNIPPKLPPALPPALSSFGQVTGSRLPSPSHQAKFLPLPSKLHCYQQK